ncbi:MAG: GDSL-type esterase/lipase family protein [Thiovulaceae bacterium]|nr:GDSL-type esterase/lipase family protein [Sulfurimonadaceae bacterium]
MLGDSITEWGIWNQLLEQTSIYNQGISGNTTQDILNRINYIDLDLKQVFLMIGINDILSGYELEYIQKNYIEIVQTLQNKRCKIILQSTLYVGRELPQEVNDAVEKLNIYIKKYAEENNLTYLDINEILAPNKYLEENYTLDGVHLSEKAYIEWSSIIKNYL